jgi:hypothetical protein
MDEAIIYFDASLDPTTEPLSSAAPFRSGGRDMLPDSGAGIATVHLGERCRKKAASFDHSRG